MPSRPYKVVYGIRKTGLTDEEGQEREQWTQIRVAFQNSDNSINVILHYLPTNLDQTRIHIRAPRPREEQPAPSAPKEQEKPIPPAQAAPAAYRKAKGR